MVVSLWIVIGALFRTDALAQKMQRWRSKFSFALEVLRVSATALYFRLRAGPNLVGQKFDTFGRFQAFRLLLRRDWHRGIGLFCNPVSCLRYYEFSFCDRAINWHSVDSYLDVSSPRLFFIYLLAHYPHLKARLINPDQNDCRETNYYLRTLLPDCKLQAVAGDARNLPYASDSFDAIVSISVIEHIPDAGDMQAIQELWRVLKPGGHLVITVPYRSTYSEEWRSTDTYGLGTEQQDGCYFFQRFYDQPALEKRLIQPTQSQPISIQFFGEKQAGIFDRYIQNWLQHGTQETIRDPYYASHDYQIFNNVSELPGFGVCNMLFKKSEE